MSGVQLLELSPSDLLDVLHFLFEEDAGSVMSAEHGEARDAMRDSIYESMYKTEYTFKASKKQNDFSGIDLPLDDEDVPVPVDPFARSGYVKPYTPATDFDPSATNPFGSVLDAPLR